jgi:uncharacterized membrane protein
MAKISSYPSASPVDLSDMVIGTDTINSNATKNFKIEDILELISGVVLTLPTYASNAAALAGGLVQGQLYASSTGVVSIVL